jgi:Rrf2 family nitric oxide-sensitive transcriptional repressor
MRIGDIILAMEEDLSIVDCDALGCILSPGCSLKAALDRGSDAFIAALNEVTLADLFGSRRMKQQFKRIDIMISGQPQRVQ